MQPIKKAQRRNALGFCIEAILAASAYPVSVSSYAYY